MEPTETLVARESEEHAIVADALASIRLFHRLYGAGAQRDAWTRELVRMLRRLGATGARQGHLSIVSGAAEAIARTYLGRGADDIDWPEGPGT